MALNKIPDSLLPKFTCANCGRYVTMAPIAVETDGQISCGNCTDWTIPKVRCNLLESLATLYAFPCKYKHAGCQKYMAFNETYDHESSCDYHTFSCPISLLNAACKWEGTATNMLRHYRKQHPQFSANHPNFKITLEDEYEKYYMIDVDHILLLLQIKSSVAHGKLWFNTVYIGEPQKACYIRYRINLSCKEVSKQVVRLQSRTAVAISNMKMDPDRSVEVIKKSLLEVLEDAKYIHCAWNIDLLTESEEIIKVDVDEKEDGNLVEAKTRVTTCPNCNILMVPPIYRCESLQNHVTCSDCKGFYNECKLCQKNGKVFKRAEDLETISKLKFYNCRWINCKGMFAFQNIRLHEMQCEHRIFKCPKCNIWSGDGASLFAHFKITHPKARISQSNPLFFNSLRFIPGYILTLNELFLLDVDVDYKRHLTICSVTYLGLPSHFNDWEFNLSTRTGRPILKHGNEANVIVYKQQPSALVNYKLSIERATKIKVDH